MAGQGYQRSLQLQQQQQRSGSYVTIGVSPVSLCRGARRARDRQVSFVQHRQNTYPDRIAIAETGNEIVSVRDNAT